MASVPHHHHHITRGILLRIGAALCFSLMSALLKLGATRGAGLIDILFYRSLLGLPVVLVWVLPHQGLAALTTRRPLAHITRSTLGLASMFCTFEALILLPLAEATTIAFLAPIFATVLSWLVLHEKVGRHRWGAALVAFAGVVVVTRPGSAHDLIAPLGVAFGLAASFGAAAVTVTLRHWGDRENVAAIVFWFMTTCTLVSGALLPWFGHSLDASTVLLLSAGGLFGGIAQIFMTASLQAAPVSVLTPFDYLQLITAVLLGWLLIGTIPTAATYAGGALIAASGLYTARREHRRRREREVPATEQWA